MTPQNCLILMSDQHGRAFSGCYGHPYVKTPNIDRLAARGTRFTRCSTPSPICVPARASFATGRPVHEIGFWDNAHPYDGSVRSWHHDLRDAGHEVTSIGKLHFRSDDDDLGFTESQIAMQVIDGVGDLMGMVRDDMPVRAASHKMASLAGSGESSYTHYDRNIAAHARDWLAARSGAAGDKPWALFVSFVCPHFPLTAPKEYYDRYYNDPDLPMPALRGDGERADHPWILEYARVCNFEDFFKTEDDIRRAVAGYFGLCSFLDAQIGEVLDALDAAGLSESTRIVYTSDHGDSLGMRGLWGKSMLYEESAGVPLIVAGDGIPAGKVVDTPASLLDICPFIGDCVGLNIAEADRANANAVSVARLANGETPDRSVLSEYHAMGSVSAGYAIWHGRYKYVHYVGMAPQLFDLEADPLETDDLAGDPAHAAILIEYEGRLRALLDPDEVDRRAKRSQAEKVAAAGGREVVIARGDLGYSPPPGTPPEFQ